VTDIERAAERSIARGVGFGALAIAMVVAGLAGYPRLALRSGACLALLMWAILRVKALRAPRRPYRETEVWLILDRPPDWSGDVAQRLIGEALRAVLERYARYVLMVAVGLWLASVALSLLGIR